MLRVRGTAVKIERLLHPGIENTHGVFRHGLGFLCQQRSTQCGGDGGDDDGGSHALPHLLSRRRERAGLVSRRVEQLPHPRRHLRAVELDAASSARRAAACRCCTSCRIASARALESVAAIFVATVSGEPTHSAPSGPASRSNCARVTGGHPRSAPMRVISAAWCGQSSSRACSSVAATWPGEWTPIGSVSWPNCVERSVEQIDVGREPPRAAADDRQHERETVVRRAHHRLRRAADADPDAERAAGLDRRVHHLIPKRRARASRPRDRLLLSSAANSSRRSSNSSSYCARSNPNSGNDSVNEPRPTITSARPFDSAFSVENRSIDADGIVGAEHRDRRAR